MFPKDTNILIVDDMMTMRKLVKKALTQLGFARITEAENGAVAWNKIKATMLSMPFQLVISDWNMPEMTGLELLKEVRKAPAIKGIPFVLLTAESEKAQVVEALQAKVSGYVIKPFTPEQLDEKLKAVWAAHHPTPKAA